MTAVAISQVCVYQFVEREKANASDASCVVLQSGMILKWKFCSPGSVSFSTHVMAPTPAQAAGQKRKASTFPSSNSRKRQKAQDARAIPVQSADAALSTSGELNVAAFMKAREFEINALGKSVQKSKKGLMTRAFQQVPRNMRRRTASHNVKKVPRRLRRRAEREVRTSDKWHSLCLLTRLTSCGLDERGQHAHSHSKA